MPKGIGKLLQIGVAKEAARGTAASAATYWLPFSDASLEEKFKNVVDVETYGVIEDSASQLRVKNWAEGPIKAPIGDIHFALFLLSLFGTDTPSLHSGETTVYDHVLTVQQGSQHQSLTLFIHDPITSADYSYALGVVHKMDIEYALGKFISYSAQIKALKGVSQSSFSPSNTIENRFLPQHVTFKVASNLAGLAAATPIKLKSFKITIDESIEDDDVLGNTSPADFLNKEFNIEGELEAIWQNESDFKTAALANTAQAMSIDILNGDVTIGTAANPEIKIELAKAYFTEFSRPIKLKDVMYQSLKFKAAYSLSDALMAKITATNTVASY